MKNTRYSFHISFLMAAILSFPALSMEKEGIFTDTFSAQNIVTKPLGLLISDDILEKAAVQYERINHEYQKHEDVFKYLIAKKCMMQLEESLNLEDSEERKEILRSALSIQGLSEESIEAIQTILIGETQELDIITSVLNDVKRIVESTQMLPDTIENIQSLLHPYTRTHLNILHNILGWNGENTGVIVLDNNFSPTSHMEYIANLEEDCLNVSEDTHGLTVASIIASHHPDAPGVARGATVIPAFINYKYMSLVNKKDRIYLAQLNTTHETVALEIDIMKRIEAVIGEIITATNTLDLNLDINMAKINELLDTKKELESTLLASSPIDIVKAAREGLDDIENEMKDKFISLGDSLLDLKTKMNLAKNQGITPYVINCSLGNMHGEIDVFRDLSHFLEENVLLWVNASGNDAGFIDDSYQEIFEIYPALSQRIIFVGSMDAHANASSFSTKPGTTYADCFLHAPGGNVKVLNRENMIDLKNGTSFAAPFISGTLVLLKKYFANLNMITLTNILLSTATPFPSYLGYDPEISGCGIVNAWQAFMKARESSAQLY